MFYYLQLHASREIMRLQVYVSTNVDAVLWSIWVLTRVWFPYVETKSGHSSTTDRSTSAMVFLALVQSNTVSPWTPWVFANGEAVTERPKLRSNFNISKPLYSL